MRIADRVERTKWTWSKNSDTVDLLSDPPAAQQAMKRSVLRVLSKHSLDGWENRDKTFYECGGGGAQ